MNEDEYPDVLAYVRASVEHAEKNAANALHVKLLGGLYAVPVSAPRGSDCSAAGDAVEGRAGDAADAVPAHRLREGEELREACTRGVAGRQIAPAGEGEAVRAARDAATSRELEIARIQQSLKEGE